MQVAIFTWFIICNWQKNNRPKMVKPPVQTSRTIINSHSWGFWHAGNKWVFFQSKNCDFILGFLVKITLSSVNFEPYYGDFPTFNHRTKYLISKLHATLRIQQVTDETWHSCPYSLTSDPPSLLRKQWFGEINGVLNAVWRKKQIEPVCMHSPLVLH